MREKVLLYLLFRFFEKFDRPLDGRKKLQKLLFLIEHYDHIKHTVRKSTGITGYKFVVWSYGPFSKEIYDDLDRLVVDKLIEEHVISSDIEPTLDLYIDDGYPKRIYYYKPSRLLIKKSKDLFKELDSSVIEKIDYILDLFGSKKSYELEKYVNSLLNLTPDKKLKYWGMRIDDYLEEGGHA